jgi:hypothetical protein
MELGEVGAEAKGAMLVKEFEDQFHTMDYTLHPRGIPREAQGKSSNICWAAKYISGRYQAAKMKRNVVITVIDGRHFKAVVSWTKSYRCLLRFPL